MLISFPCAQTLRGLLTGVVFFTFSATHAMAQLELAQAMPLEARSEKKPASPVTQSEKLGFLNVGLGLTHSPLIKYEFAVGKNEQVDFENQPSTYFELGRSFAVNPDMNLAILAGFEYAKADLNRKIDTDAGRESEDYDSRRTTFFVGLGTDFEIAPKFTSKIFGRLGFSQLGLTSNGREDGKMDFYSFGPEVQLNYRFNNNFDFQVMGNYMLHYGDGNYLDFDNYSSYMLGAGVSIPLELP